MPSNPKIDAYHFYEEEWESYEALYKAFEWDVPERFNIAAYVCDRWADDPNRTAVYSEDDAGKQREFTFRELRDAANRLANYLETEGVKRGDRVGINLPQKPETAVAHLACWKLGAVSVPLSVKFGPDALSYRLDDAGAKVMMVDDANVKTFRDVQDGLDAIETVLTVDTDTQGNERDLWTTLEDHSAEFETADTRAEDDAIIIYTSGTTGDPKGVLHAHRFFLGHLPLFLTDFCNMEIEENDLFWLPSEWSWIAAFDIVFPAWFYGKPVLAYEADGFDPETAFDLIDRYGVTVSFIPPTALRMMKTVDSALYELDSMRVIPTGGEALDRDTFEWAFETFGEDVAVHEGYGQTEANMLVANCTALAEYKVGKLGLAGPGHEVAIVDPETAEPTVRTGEVGEIAVRYEGDPVCFKEYWNKPAKTDQKVQNGWILTEDLGSVDEDGYFTFEGRKDDVIISSGYRIGPEEIEESLTDHSAVAHAGVVGVPDAERGEVPKAFVELTGDHEASAELVERLQDHVKDRLARYEYPREIEMLPELPKTTTGKVQRSALEEREE